MLVLVEVDCFAALVRVDGFAALAVTEDEDAGAGAGAVFAVTALPLPQLCAGWAYTGAWLMAVVAALVSMPAALYCPALGWAAE